MKQVLIVIVFISFLLLPVFALPENIQTVEISCEMLETLISHHRMVKNYKIWGFYIDDLNKKLYYAPSGKEVQCTSIIFNDNEILLKGCPFAGNSTGNININRNSGAINMNYKGSDFTCSYEGNCTKVDKTIKRF